MRGGLKVLVTGGCGFIGCHVVRRWAERHQVLALDNLSRRGSEANLAWLRRTCPFEFLQRDIRDAGAMVAAVRDFQPDVVVHEAAQVAVTTSVADPRLDFDLNALGTLNVLEATRLHAPRATFLYASTNKVYGGMEDTGVVLRDGRYAYESLPGGVAESQPLDFHSPYGCSKGAGDQYVRDYARVFGLNTVVFRQSCIYGTRQFGVEDQGWIAWFTIRAVQGRPVTIFGDGRQVRDVLWVEDLIDAYERVTERIDRTRGQVYNLGGGPECVLSLLELVDLLTRELGKPLTYSFGDWRPGDQRVFVADVSKAERDFGWRPKVRPVEGVRQLATWVEENRDLFTDPE